MSARIHAAMARAEARFEAEGDSFKLATAKADLVANPWSPATIATYGSQAEFWKAGDYLTPEDAEAFDAFVAANPAKEAAQ